MVGCEQMARAQYVSEIARRTVWVRQKTDKRWEAIDWMGTVISEGKYRASVEYDLKQMAASPVTNIYAIATITEPSKRQPHRRHPSRRYP